MQRDRSGKQLRKERYEGKVADEATNLGAAAGDIEQKGDLLKSVERDRQGGQDMQQMPAPAKRGRRRVEDRAEIFEIKQQSDIGADPNPDQRGLERL